MYTILLYPQCVVYTRNKLSSTCSRHWILSLSLCLALVKYIWEPCIHSFGHKSYTVRGYIHCILNTNKLSISTHTSVFKVHTLHMCTYKLTLPSAAHFHLSHNCTHHTLSHNWLQATRHNNYSNFSIYRYKALWHTKLISWLTASIYSQKLDSRAVYVLYGTMITWVTNIIIFFELNNW